MSEIRNLIDRLNKYRDCYYNRNKSLISDKDYDALYDRLVALEKSSGIIYPDSPTQTVGYEVVSNLKKVKHNHPLLSLDKETDLNKFVSYFGKRSVCLMAKMDGLTASIRYVDGKLVSAESRGNGEVGEDITHNARTFVNLPQTIGFDGELIVDGECIIDRKTFNEINEYEETKYKNPRNLVSGTVRQLDSKIAASRKVRFIAWKLYSAKNKDGSTLGLSNDRFLYGLNILSDLGFEVVPFEFVSKNKIKEANNSFQFLYQQKIELIKAKCREFHYPIDGIVGAFDDVQYGYSLGSTGHHPRHSMAFKFYQEENRTRLLNIVWNTSRTGLVNPVAVVEPVEIDGTTVSRASLSNVSIIKELQLGIGDELTIIKANQIIPMIKDNLTRSGTYQIPRKCPSCGGNLILKNDTGRETLLCTNKKCLAINHDKLANFVSRDAMNIVGISEERLFTLMRLGYLWDFKSIYDLKNHKDELIKIDGFGKSSVDNLLNAIEQSKTCKFSNVLVALGIPGIGKSAAKTISKHCFSINNGVNKNGVFKTFLEMAKCAYNWAVLDNFGDVSSYQINDYINQHLDEILPLVGILNIENENASSNNKLAGNTFCVTGKLFKYQNRDALLEDIEKNGGKVVSSVTAKTNYLITNEPNSGSSKNQKAAKFGTKIITEDEFIDMVKA